MTIKFIIKEKIIPELKKYKKIITEFRELFDFDNANYSDKILLKVLKKNDFDFELAFADLFE